MAAIGSRVRRDGPGNERDEKARDEKHRHRERDVAVREDEPDDFDAPYSDGETRSATLAFAVPNAILLALVVTSLLLVRRHRPALPAVLVPFAVLALLAFGLHALVAAYPRMLVPIVPLAVFFVAATLTALAENRTERAHAAN